FIAHDTATRQPDSLALHDALPISTSRWPNHTPSGELRMGKPTPPPDVWDNTVRSARWMSGVALAASHKATAPGPPHIVNPPGERSEEHTSELQSRENLVCRLLLEK